MKLIKYVTLSCLFLCSSLASAQTPVFFSPYADLTLNVHWDSTYGDLEPFDLADLSATTGVKRYYLAFITDAGSCMPAWGAQSSYAVAQQWGKHLTDKLQANHIEYVVSFGGASGNDISKACQLPQLQQAFEQVINTYQPQGLDFDIENGTADVTKIMHALQGIQAAHPELALSFTLPVMPYGLVAAGEDVLRKAQAAGLNYTVNIMAMDYGPEYTSDMAEYAMQAGQSLFNFLQSLYPNKSAAELWQMIIITPMIGINDVNVEKFTLQNANTLASFAKNNKLAGLAMWSVSRDKPCAGNFSSPTCSGGNLQTKDNEFSLTFLNGLQ